jgi:hypothetical protein
MAKFRDFVARQLPVTKVRRGSNAEVAARARGGNTERPASGRTSGGIRPILLKNSLRVFCEKIVAL